MISCIIESDRINVKTGFANSRQKEKLLLIIPMSKFC